MDVQFVQYLDLVPLRQVLPVKNAALPILELHGQDFSKVVSVYMNGVRSPDVVVMSRTRLLAQVPNIFVGQKISDIAVYSSGLILTERTKLKFSLGGNKTSSGFEKLIQLFVKLLLQTPGTSSYDPAGGGLLSMVGSNFGAEKSKSIEGRVLKAVELTATTIQQRQQRNSRIPVEERLLSATVIQVRAVPEAGEVHVRIEFRNQTGRVGVAAVTTTATELAA